MKSVLRHLAVASSLAITVLVQTSAFAAATKPYVLITDVDDTIKVSHVVDPVSKVIRFLSDPVSFAGMSTLYHAMIDEAGVQGQDTNFVVLSGTPSLFESSIWNFLELFNFPEPTQVTTRPMLENTQQYKTDVVGKIANRLESKTKAKDSVLVMIGDDTEFDFAAYSAATRRRRTQGKGKTQIYIRRVTGQANATVGTQPGASAFDSAADIAVLEFIAGRLPMTAVQAVFREIENEQEAERLFVPEEYCASGDRTRLSRVLTGSNPGAAQVPAAVLAGLIAVEDHLRERCDSLALTENDLLEIKKSFILNMTR